MRHSLSDRASAGGTTRRLAAAAGATLLVGAGLVTGAGGAAAADSTTLSFTTVADTWVNAAYPTTSYGTSTRMTVDASPESQALLRFDLSTLTGKTVTGVTLRLYQGDASSSGGRVHPLPSTTWTESATWNTRPALGTDVLATFGAVSSGNWYEVALDPGALTAGLTSLGMTSTSGDGARWGTRESTTKPQLLVTVAADTSSPPPAPSDDGVTAVAAADVGSSEPTYYSGNHRLAVTSGGRLLAVHGRHRSGVQLTWRDPGGAWQTSSTGASTSGGVLTGTGTGDWPASLAVAKDASGVEHAWVVFTGPAASALRPVQMRRLSNLDDPAGPFLGPLVTVDPAPLGAFRADIAFENGRGCVLYSRQVGDTAYEVTTVWFTALGTDTPTFSDRTVLHSTTSKYQYGSLVATAAGLRAVARTGTSSNPKLQIYTHAASAPLTSWAKGATGPFLPYGSSPNATALSSGEVVVAVEDDTTNDVGLVYRFSADGTTGTTMLRQTGFAQPTIVSDGSGLTLLASRTADGALVSRTWSATGGWTTADRVEVDPAQTGRLAWPNALRQTDGRLRVLAEGPGTTTSTSSVWGYARSLQG